MDKPKPSKSSGSPSGPASESVGGAGISDTATDKDLLGFDPYVKALSAFLTHHDTKPPLTVSIEGPWGSGKSSFMLQLMEDVAKRPIGNGKPPLTIRFNAWRLDKEEALWAAFALSVTQSLAEALPLPLRVWAHIQLQFERFDLKKGWFGLVRFLILFSLLVFTGWSISSHLLAHPELLPSLSSSSGQKEKWDDVLVPLLLTALGSGGYVFLGAMLLRKALDVIGNPFEVDLKQYSQNLNYESRVAFIQKFHKDFSLIVDTYAKGRTVFAFIDDLDRCEIPKAAELMQAINLLLSDSAQIVYVLGLDREKIAAGLAAKFKEVLPFLNEKRDGTAGQGGLDFGYSFIEKFIQIPFQVPKPAAQDVDRLLKAINREDTGITPASGPDVSSAVLFETRADSDLVRNIVKEMAVSLEYNPRRIKQFINHFRLSAIIASQTGLFHSVNTDLYSALTPHILGKLLAITLRWPLLIEDAVSHPGLLYRLEILALGKNESPSGLERFWIEKAPLRHLLSIGSMSVRPGLNTMSNSYSFHRLDLERFLQVSPMIVNIAATPYESIPHGRKAS